MFNPPALSVGVPVKLTAQGSVEFTWTPPNGVQNFADVQAAIHAFQGVSSAAPLYWADVEPEVPNRVVNFNDVLQLVLAFTGQPYPFGDPANCP